MPIERKHVATTLFLAAMAVIALYFCFVITRPFLTPIFLAMMLAIIFYPAHVRIHTRVRGRNSAALLSTALVILAFLVPAIVLGAVVSRETRGLYELLNEKSTAQGGWNPYVMHALERVTNWAGKYIDVSHLDLRGTVMRWLGQLSSYLLSWGAHVVSNFISFIGNSVVVFFTLFFFFREGGQAKQHASEILPLTLGQVDRLFTEVSNSIVANVYGAIAVGVFQGAFAALSFWILGLPSPVLWGLVTALFSLVPLIGSAAVWGPAAIVLAISGHWIKALILLGLGAGVIGQVDSLVRPYVISEHAKMNTLLVFFALLGGVNAFGVMGLFIGPVVLSFTLVVLAMLHETILEHTSS